MLSHDACQHFTSKVSLLLWYVLTTVCAVMYTDITANVYNCPDNHNLNYYTGCYIYTVNQKKRGNLFLSITLANLNRFL